MINVNQKILWLADFDLDRSPGGAQRSDKIIIDQGKLLGFNILKTNHETFGKHINIHEIETSIFRTSAILNDLGYFKLAKDLESLSDFFLDKGENSH